LKVKSDWYFRLHRLFTGTSAKTIWENLVAGLDVESAFAELPSEFSQWAIDTASRLRTAHRTTLEEVEAEFQELVVELGEGYTRKDFALAVAERPTRGYLFARLDNRDLSPMVWKNLRPASEKPFASDPDEAEVL
jgi:RNA ligase